MKISFLNTRKWEGKKTFISVVFYTKFRHLVVSVFGMQVWVETARCYKNHQMSADEFIKNGAV